MNKRVRNIFKRGQKGFTLIELVAVMGILAILVAVVTPNVIETRNSSIEAQAQTDASAVRGAATDFFKNVNESEVRTPHTITTTAGVNGSVTTAVQQEVSSRWPEIYITEESGAPTLTGRSATSGYSQVFETTEVAVDDVKLLDKNGVDITDLFTTYTAIDLTQLVDDDLLVKEPDGVGLTSQGMPNFLWLFRKVSSSSASEAANDSREVVVFNLIKVEKQEDATQGVSSVGDLVLTYKRIF